MGKRKNSDDTDAIKKKIKKLQRKLKKKEEDELGTPPPPPPPPLSPTKSRSPSPVEFAVLPEPGPTAEPDIEIPGVYSSNIS